MKTETQKQKSDSRFAYKLNSGYLLGREYKNAPCKKCIGMWLTERKVSNILVDVKEITISQDLSDSLENGVIYEIAEDGTPTRLECTIEKHPDCNCKGKTVEYPSKKINYAFTSISKMKVSRFATPTGNVWLCEATHRNGVTKNATGTDREGSRTAAVNSVKETVFGVPSKMSALKSEVISTYTSLCKTPMLIVGTNNWTRTHLPYFILQKFDVYLFFYPNAQAAWVTGALAISRTNPKAIPVWSYGASQNIDEALKQAMHGLLDETREECLEEQHEKLGVWQSQWVYRCPKISLKDVLHLEQYSVADLERYTPKEVQSTLVRPVFRLVLGGKLDLRKVG